MYSDSFTNSYRKYTCMWNVNEKNKIKSLDNRTNTVVWRGKYVYHIYRKNEQSRRKERKKSCTFVSFGVCIFFEKILLFVWLLNEGDVDFLPFLIFSFVLSISIVFVNGCVLDIISILDLVQCVQSEVKRNIKKRIEYL